MKKHLVQFSAQIDGCIVVEGDDTLAQAKEYVLKHLEFSAEAEAVDAELTYINTSIEWAREEK